MGEIPLQGGEMNIEHTNTRPQDHRASERPPLVWLLDVFALLDGGIQWF